MLNPDCHPGQNGPIYVGKDYNQNKLYKQKVSTAADIKGNCW